MRMPCRTNHPALISTRTVPLHEKSARTLQTPFHRLIVRIQRRVAPVLTRTGPRGLLPKSAGDAAIVKEARAKSNHVNRSEEVCEPESQWWNVRSTQ